MDICTVYGNSSLYKDRGSCRSNLVSFRVQPLKSLAENAKISHELISQIFYLQPILYHRIRTILTALQHPSIIMAVLPYPVLISLPLPVLPENWSAEKDFKAIGKLSSATLRNLEPVGPHFLAHARRVCDHQPCSFLCMIQQLLTSL